MAAVRDGIIPALNNTDSESFDFTSMSGKPHNTFHGVHTKYRAPLSSDHPLLNNSQHNGSMDLDYYAAASPEMVYRQQRAVSLEPSQVHSNTMGRHKRDVSKERRKRHTSGDRHRRGVSVDRTRGYDSSLDRRRDKSVDKTRSEVNLNSRRDISVERNFSSRDASLDRGVGDSSISGAWNTNKGDSTIDRSTLGHRTPIDTDSSDSDTEGGNYVVLSMPHGAPPTAVRSASRQTSSESCNSVFERGTTPRSSNTSQGRPSFHSPGFTRINYGDASPHYSPVSMHQPLYGQNVHHSSPISNRNPSPSSVSFTNSEANDYVNVNWKPVDDIPDEPAPPRPPRPTRLDIKNPPNCSTSNIPPKTQPRMSRSQAGTPISDTDVRSRFSPGGSPPPTLNHQKTLLTIEVDDKHNTTTTTTTSSSSNITGRKPALPPKPCPGPQHSIPQTPSSEYL